MERPVVISEFIESDYDNKLKYFQTFFFLYLNREDRDGIGESFLSNEAACDIMSHLCKTPDGRLAKNRCRTDSFNDPRSTVKSNLRYILQDPDQSQEIIKASDEAEEINLYQKVTSER